MLTSPPDSLSSHSLPQTPVSGPPQPTFQREEPGAESTGSGLWTQGNRARASVCGLRTQEEPDRRDELSAFKAPQSDPDLTPCLGFHR